MHLLPQEPAPVTRYDAALTRRFLLPSIGSVEALFSDIRRETDEAIGRSTPRKYGKPYPVGYCREITYDVLARLKDRMRKPQCRGGKAMKAFLNAGGSGRCIWGALRETYFQTALQFGSLYIDVANDTVTVTKPKVEILPLEDSGLKPITDAWHFARIATCYWQAELFANHALPSLAPIVPMIAVFPGKRVRLQSGSDYMMDLFRRDGFRSAEDWLKNGPAPPDGLIDAVRNWTPDDILAANRASGAAVAVEACRLARESGQAGSIAWRNDRRHDLNRIVPS